MQPIKNFIATTLEIPEDQQVVFYLEITPTHGAIENCCFENTSRYVAANNMCHRIPCWVIYTPQTLVDLRMNRPFDTPYNRHEYQAEAHSIVFNTELNKYIDITPGYRGLRHRTILLETRMNQSDFLKCYSGYVASGGDKIIPPISNVRSCKKQMAFLKFMRMTIYLFWGEETCDNYEP